MQQMERVRVMELSGASSGPPEVQRKRRQSLAGAEELNKVPGSIMVILVFSSNRAPESQGKLERLRKPKKQRTPERNGEELSLKKKDLNKRVLQSNLNYLNRFQFQN